MITTLCLAFFTDDCIYGLIVPVLPFALPERSGVPEEEVQFWTSAMLTAFGLANLLGSRKSDIRYYGSMFALLISMQAFLGKLADHFPRKSFLLFGLILLGVATVLFGAVTNVYALVASRLLQGLSAAIVYIGGLALLVDTVDPNEVGQWMGFVMSFGNAGLLVSPFLGGLIYSRLGFGAVFLSMLVLVLCEIILRLLMIVNPRDRSLASSHGRSKLGESREDAISEEEPLLRSISDQRANLPGDVPSTNSETENSRPNIFMILIKSKRVLAALYGVLVAQTLITSFDGVLPIFLHQQFGWSSTRAGVMFLTLTIPTLASPVTGMLADKVGSRWVAVAGYLLAAVILGILPVTTHRFGGQIALLCVLLTSLGKPPLLALRRCATVCSQHLFH